MKLKYCTYVLLSEKDGMFYVGSTGNLERRLTEHFNGKSKSTASRRPLRLIFTEYYLSKQDVIRREKYFKTTAGKKTLRLMLRESLVLARAD